MSTQTGDGPSGEAGRVSLRVGFFRAVRAAGERGLRVSLEKVIRQGSLRSGDIHHIVCEKHCLMPSFFFFLCVSLNRGSVCASPSIY